MIEPIWLNLRAVLILHQESLEEHGGLDGIRDQGLLEAALARAENLFHYETDTNIHRLAATYAYGIVRNHPFNDGNKRAAFIAAVLFLRLNKFRFTASQGLATQAMVELAAGEMSTEAFTEWLALHSTEID